MAAYEIDAMLKDGILGNPRRLESALHDDSDPSVAHR